MRFLPENQPTCARIAARSRALPSAALLTATLALCLALPGPSAGINVENTWPDASRHQGFGEPCFGDLDNDGDLDVVLVHHGEGVFVWRNDGGESWTDRTTQVTREVNDPHGCAMGDFDDDGDLDIFVSKGGGFGKLLGKKADPLFRNDGNFNFTDITRDVGTENTQGRGRTPLWFDHDDDGDLDLLIQNLSSPHILLRNDGGTFTDITDASGLSSMHEKLFIRHPVDHDMDGDMDLIVGGFVEDAYFENRDGRFVERTAAVGLGQQPGASTFCMADFDRDGDLDLFVARNWNDKKRQVHWDSSRAAFADKRAPTFSGLDIDASGSLRFKLFARSEPVPDFTFLGSSKATAGAFDFTRSPSASDVQGAPDVDTSDSDGFYIWRSGGLWHLRWKSVDKNPYVFGEITAVSGQIFDVDKVDIPDPEIPPYRNSLYRNDNGVFRDITDEAKIPAVPGDRTPGAACADFNSDGWPDLYIVRAGLRVVGDDPDILLINQGNGTFKDFSRVVPTSKNGLPVGIGEGAGAVDVNGDAKPDLFVKAGNAEPEPGAGPDKLFLNPVGGRRILVTLEAVASAPGAFGAKVLVEAGGSSQLQENWGGPGNMSYHQGAGLPLHFGLGKASQADRVLVTWPSGFQDVVFNVPAGSRIHVVEGVGPTTTGAGLPYRDGWPGARDVADTEDGPPGDGGVATPREIRR